MLNAAGNAPKMSEANRRGHSSEARSEKGEPGVCERPRQNAGQVMVARGILGGVVFGQAQKRPSMLGNDGRGGFWVGEKKF